MTTTNKSRATKTITDRVPGDHGCWTIHYGELKRGRGRPQKTEHLFKVIGEKLPYEALPAVKKDLQDRGHTFQGVYVAHDSMGCPRYIGRGNIFARLEARKKSQQLELDTFPSMLCRRRSTSARSKPCSSVRRASCWNSTIGRRGSGSRLATCATMKQVLSSMNANTSVADSEPSHSIPPHMR